MGLPLGSVETYLIRLPVAIASRLTASVIGSLLTIVPGFGFASAKVGAGSARTASSARTGMGLARCFFIVVRLSIGLEERAKDRTQKHVVAPAGSPDVAGRASPTLWGETWR